MSAILITSFLLLAVISYVLYRWHTGTNIDAERALPPAPSPFEGLFAEEDKRQAALQQSEDERNAIEAFRHSLLERAAHGDKETLREAHQSGEQGLYDEVLNALVAGAVDSAKKVFTLVSYITRQDNGLRVNKRLAEAFMETWKMSPDRRTTAEMLHVAALAADAHLYHSAVESALECWRHGKLAGLSAVELGTLIESEFWVLAPAARNSGAGFILKRKLAGLRRELATAKSV